MKRMLAVLAVSLALTGCVQPQGELVHSSTVGQVKYVGGTGLVYARQSPQVSASSVRAGEEYLAQVQANDPIARDQQRVMANAREMDAQYENQLVARKCQMVIEIHAAALKNEVYNNPTSKNINEFENFRRGGSSAAFDRCVETHKR